jgi:hypothetical protein
MDPVNDPRSLQSAVAALRLDEPRLPAWSTLRLDRHLTALKLSLVVYLGLLITLWLQVFNVVHVSDRLAAIVGTAFVLLYVFIVGDAFFVQKVMNEAGVYKRGAWQIIVGAAVLNPCALGWWLPVSVILAAGRVKRRLDELEAAGATLAATVGSSPSSRPVQSVEPPTVLKRLFMAAALLFLFVVVSAPLQLLVMSPRLLRGTQTSETVPTVASRVLSIAIVLLACPGAAALLRLVSRSARYYTLLRLSVATVCGLIGACAGDWVMFQFWPGAPESLPAFLFLASAIAGVFLVMNRPPAPHAVPTSLKQLPEGAEQGALTGMTDGRAKDILAIFDRCCEAHTFPMLDNGYYYLAATRLSLYRSAVDWALVIETFGFSPRAGDPNITIETFASRLHQRDEPTRYVSREAYERYIVNHPHDEYRAVFPVESGPWQDDEDGEVVSDTAKEVVVRGRPVTLPDRDEYVRRGVNLEKPPRVRVFELCRYLADVMRDEVLATSQERRVSVLPEMDLLLQLEEWHHPDLAGGEVASDSETFRQLASVLATGDIGLYRPSLPPNTHWSHWPDGGTL